MSQSLPAQPSTPAPFILAQTPSLPQHWRVRRPVEADALSISRLSERVFGPGRFARTAYRVREGSPHVSPYCQLMEANGVLIAALRMTAISIGGCDQALLLGPLAVDPDHENRGFGRQLIAESTAAARAGGMRLILLVGDLAYYGRLGYVAAAPGQILFPGPVDPARVLIHELVEGAGQEYAGLVRAAPA